MLELADDDWSEPDELDGAPADGLDDGLDLSDEAIPPDGDDEGLDGLDCDMLDELGGVADDVLWRSLQATASNAAAIATDSTEAFICFSFRDECK